MPNEKINMLKNDDWDDMPTGGMADEFKVDEVAGRKITPVFFLIDTSGSMSGAKIGTVNAAMEDIVKDLADFDSPDSEIRFAVLSFSSGCNWETGESGLIPCGGDWNDLTAGGLTYFNAACRELKAKMSGKNGFFKFAAGRSITPPVVILLTDGFANDGSSSGDEGVAELSQNKYYQGSIKLAIAIGDDANLKLCENFTGDKETVFTVYTSGVLKKLLKEVAQRSVAVSSSGTSDGFNMGKLDQIKTDTTELKKGLEQVMADIESQNISANTDWDD